MDAALIEARRVSIVAAARDGDELTRLLAQHGYAVDCARDCSAAVGQAQASQLFALLLVARASASEICTQCARLAADPALASVPILCLASADDPRPPADYFAAGATDYLRAPWSPAEFLARLRAHGERARRWRQQLAASSRSPTHAPPLALATPTMTALQASETSYRALVEALPDLLIRMDSEGTYLDVIPGCNAQMGVPAVAKIGVHVRDLLPPEIAEQQIAAARLALATDSLQTFEQTLAINHNTCHEEVSVVPCGTGEVLLVVRDVTERQNAAIALQCSEARLRAIASNLPGVIYTLARDADGHWHFEYMSDACRELFEVDAAAIMADASLLTARIHPGDRPLYEQRVAASETQMLPFSHEWRQVLPSGQIRWLLGNARPERRPDGSMVWNGVVLDITARKQAEADLQASEATNRALLRAIPDLLIRIRRDGQRLAFFGSDTMLTFGEADRHLNEPIGNQLPPELAQRRLAAIQAALATGQLQTDEYEIVIAGEPHYEESRIVPVNEDEVLVMVRDMTERQQAATDLRVARDAAEAANRAKSAFLANMSHELRTPLNAVLGFAQLLADSDNLTAVQQHNLDVIQRSGQHLLDLIDDILDLSKIEADRVSVESEAFDLYQLLDELQTMFQLRADQKRLQLCFYRAPDLPRYIRSDRRKLSQIAINLLSNALKFTPQGQVTLAAERLDGGPDTDDSDRACLLFSVSDTGIGIDPAEIGDLFDPFVQAAAGRQHAEGTGLGLAISRRYVQLLGSELELASQVGQGSTFQFELEVDLAVASDLSAASWWTVESTMPLVAQTEPAPDTTLDVAALLAQTSPAWRTTAQNAVMLLDSDAIEQAIAELPPQHAALAQKLRQYADDFRYDTLLELLQAETSQT